MSGAELIAQERQRQIEEECYSPQHDSFHWTEGELTAAAICYATIASAQARWRDSSVEFGLPAMWPFEADDWKPKDSVRNLVKAGALIAAEIDRLQRRKNKEQSHA